MRRTHFFHPPPPLIHPMISLMVRPLSEVDEPQNYEIDISPPLALNLQWFIPIDKGHVFVDAGIGRPS